MSTVTITSRPTRINVAVRGTQGPPGPTGDITPQLEALRDQVIADAASAGQSAQGAAGAAIAAEGAASASATASDAAQAAVGAAESARDAAVSASSTAVTAVQAAVDAASAAEASAGAAGTDAEAAQQAAAAAGNSATGAAAAAASAAGAATDAGTSASNAAASEAAASGSATSAAASATQAAALASGEYTVFIDDDVAITNGGYPVTRSVRHATTLDRFYAEVLTGESMVVTVEKNGVIAHGPVAVEFGTPVTQAVNIPVALGDRLTYSIVATAKRVWLSLDGIIA